MLTYPLTFLYVVFDFHIRHMGIAATRSSFPSLHQQNHINAATDKIEKAMNPSILYVSDWENIIFKQL